MVEREAGRCFPGWPELPQQGIEVTLDIVVGHGAALVVLKTGQRIEEKEGFVRSPFTSPPPLIDGGNVVEPFLRWLHTPIMPRSDRIRTTQQTVVYLRSDHLTLLVASFWLWLYSDLTPNTGFEQPPLRF